MPPVISVKRLTKQFKDVKAVDDLSFEVPAGEIYGFLGQNGAGKSTSIRMLLTLISPSSGTIELFGMDLRKHRKEILRKVGAIIERPDLYKYLTALENLKIFAAMSGVKIPQKKYMEQLEMVGLADRAGSKVRTYSQGMKQRLGIATALIHDPELIILDEPTNGLDPQGIADIRNLILHLSKDLHKTLLVSSHLLSEMELIADSMLIIDKGKKLVEGKVKDLFDPAASLVSISSTDDAATLGVLRESVYRDMLVPTGDGIQLRLDKLAVPKLVQELSSRGVGILSIHSKNSLEDYFLSLTSANQHVESFKN